MKNPYSELLQVMREQGAKYNPPTIEIGQIISATPLKIKINDLQLDKSDIYINDSIKSSLIAGDLVAVLPMTDRQKFIVLCKVVSL
ncbi:Protein of unknown function [Caloramator quimbayensis]|uniref:Uncharacterized protein n=1 Tax=Caloramator quimbayensis TaxID=1147123 RepID=A0A1T4YDC9_9CLOT|nr:DUF2577 family protein [Caloramator quimbayensis]SKA99321.1 Protein of unknown function [Caloramator quimbayensis]